MNDEISGGTRKPITLQFGIASQSVMFEFAKQNGEKYQIFKRNGHWRVRLSGCWLYSSLDFDKCLEYVASVCCR